MRLNTLVRAPTFYIYMMASRSGTIYIGVTNDIRQRIYEHRYGLLPGFTSKHNIHHLVYVEEFDRADEAFAREKQLKGWTRRRKIALIESMNRSFKDLRANWLSD